MNAIAIAAIYFVVWWIVLFAVLPFGIKTQGEEKDVTLGTTRSAPARLNLVPKAIATTFVAGFLVFLLWLAIDVYGFDLERIATTFDIT